MAFPKREINEIESPKLREILKEDAKKNNNDYFNLHVANYKTLNYVENAQLNAFLN